MGDDSQRQQRRKMDGVTLDLVQQLFERQLGPGPSSLPDGISAASSSRGADSRELERVRFKVSTGRAFEYQAVPAAGALLGLTYHPARQPPPRPRRRQNQQARGQAPVAPQPPPQPQPAHATAWAVLRPSNSIGITSSLSAVDGGPTGFAGWSQEGFVDLSRRASLEYSLARHPASGVSGEVDLLATLPKLLLLPHLTARHRVAGAQATPGVRHCSTLSAPLLGGAALALARLQVQVQEGPAAEAAGSTVTLEVVGRSRGSRGLAGGARVQPALAGAFHGDGGKASLAPESTSDSEDDRSGGSCGGRCSGSGGFKAAAGSGEQQQQQQARRMPGLRLQAAPATARSWEDLSGSWRQSWGSRLSSSVGYRGQQRRWDLQLSTKLTSRLSAGGSLTCDGPASTAAAAEAAAEVASAGGGRPHQLASYLRTYAEGGQLCKAALRLSCRLQRPSRQLVQLESSFDVESGPAHGLLYRLGGRGSDFLQQRGCCAVGLQARPRQSQLDLTFDFFAPL